MAKPYSKLGQLSVEQKTMGQMSVEQKRCRRRFLGQLSLGKFVWGKCRSIPSKASEGIEGTLYVLPKDSVLTVEDRAIVFPSVCFCVVFIKIQNTAFWQHCISGECAFSKLTKPLHLHMYRVNGRTTGFPSRIVPTKHIV